MRTGGQLAQVIVEHWDWLLNLEGDRCRLAQALHARAIDFAVISGDLPEIGLQRRAMWSERIMVMLHDEHMLALP